MTRVVSAGLVAISIFCCGAPAHAQGQCEFLSFSRNKIYKAAGYCFKTAAQIRNFGNAGCVYDNQGEVPLSARQRSEIAAIVEEERALGCR